MGAGGFPIDLVLFGMIAAFLVLRLRSILGRRTGFERPPEPRPAARTAEFRGETIEAQAEPVPPAPGRAMPDSNGPVGQTLHRMAELDRSFDAVRFLSGAETAFRMIVTGFAAGHRDALRGLLSEEMFQAFDAAITAREKAGETQRSDIKAISSATIEEADLRGNQATIAVRFVSDQVSVTLGADGQPVAGADAVTEIVDHWTFERDLVSNDPSWRLVAARSA